MTQRSQIDTGNLVSEDNRIIKRLKIVGLGGTLRAGSSTERAVAQVLAVTEAMGAEIQLIAGPKLEMPFYNPATENRTREALELVEALRGADGIVIGSPGYHGSVSGLIKNALDYAEDMSGDERAYFDGRAVGLLASGAGMAGAMTTLGALRDIGHALRGFVTPFGYAFNSADRSGTTLASGERQVKLLGEQIFELARQLSS